MIYTGSQAVQEDVDAVGLSILSGAHMTLFPLVLDELRRRGSGDILLFGGGIIPDEDRDELLRRGVKALSTPRAPTPETTDWVGFHGRARAV